MSTSDRHTPLWKQQQAQAVLAARLCSMGFDLEVSAQAASVINPSDPEAIELAVSWITDQSRGSTPALDPSPAPVDARVPPLGAGSAVDVDAGGDGGGSGRSTPRLPPFASVYNDSLAASSTRVEEVAAVIVKTRIRELLVSMGYSSRVASRASEKSAANSPVNPNRAYLTYTHVPTPSSPRGEMAAAYSPDAQALDQALNALEIDPELSDRSDSHVADSNINFVHVAGLEELGFETGEARSALQAVGDYNQAIVHLLGARTNALRDEIESEQNALARIRARWDQRTPKSLSTPLPEDHVRILRSLQGQRDVIQRQEQDRSGVADEELILNFAQHVVELQTIAAHYAERCRQLRVLEEKQEAVQGQQPSGHRASATYSAMAATATGGSSRHAAVFGAAALNIELDPSDDAESISTRPLDSQDSNPATANSIPTSSSSSSDDLAGREQVWMSRARFRIQGNRTWDAADGRGAGGGSMVRSASSGEQDQERERSRRRMRDVGRDDTPITPLIGSSGSSEITLPSAGASARDMGDEKIPTGTSVAADVQSAAAVGTSQSQLASRLRDLSISARTSTPTRVDADAAGTSAALPEASRRTGLSSLSLAQLSKIYAELSQLKTERMHSQSRRLSAPNLAGARRYSGSPADSVGGAMSSGVSSASIAVEFLPLAYNSLVVSIKNIDSDVKSQLGQSFFVVCSVGDHACRTNVQIATAIGDYQQNFIAPVAVRSQSGRVPAGASSTAAPSARSSLTSVGARHTLQAPSGSSLYLSDSLSSSQTGSAQSLQSLQSAASYGNVVFNSRDLQSEGLAVHVMICDLDKAGYVGRGQITLNAEALSALERSQMEQRIKLECVRPSVYQFGSRTSPEVHMSVTLRGSKANFTSDMLDDLGLVPLHARNGEFAVSFPADTSKQQASSGASASDVFYTFRVPSFSASAAMLNSSQGHGQGAALPEEKTQKAVS